MFTIIIIIIIIIMIIIIIIILVIIVIIIIICSTLSIPIPCKPTGKSGITSGSLNWRITCKWIPSSRQSPCLHRATFHTGLSATSPDGAQQVIQCSACGHFSTYVIIGTLWLARKGELWGVIYGSIKPDSCSVAVIAVLYGISWNVAPCYNSIRMYQTLKTEIRSDANLSSPVVIDQLQCCQWNFALFHHILFHIPRPPEPVPCPAGTRYAQRPSGDACHWGAWRCLQWH